MDQGGRSGVSRPTILFVHGAWDNGSAWDPVCRLLQEYGYPTVAPSLPSAGGRPPVPSHLKDADVIREELRRLVTEEHREVITVGHSYGSFVVTESIRGFEDFRVGQGGVIHCLVMSAFIGCKGDSVMSLLDHKMPEFLELDVSIAQETPSLQSLIQIVITTAGKSSLHSNQGGQHGFLQRR